MKPRSAGSPDRVAAARREVAERLQARIDEVADAMLASYRKEITAYAAIDDPVAIAEVRAISRTNLMLILRAIAEGEDLSEQALAVLRELGRRRAMQGFPLHAILRAYQVGTRIAWQFVIEELHRLDVGGEVVAEVVAQVSVAILGLTALVSGAVSQAFLEAERETAQVEERTRDDFFDELLAGPVGGAEPLRERGARFGYRLRDAHAVAVLSVEGLDSRAAGGEDEVYAIVREVADALRAGRPGGNEPLVQQRGTAIIAILPVPPGHSDSAVRAVIERVLLSAPVTAGVEVMGAVGGVERGIAGIGVSYRQALRALDAARATGTTHRLSSYVEMLPTLMLLQDPSLATDLWRATIEPLARHDAEHGGQLVATLSALFQERGNLVATARRLFVHRHTLSARLERIEELTGWSPRERPEALLLELGLHAQEVLRVEGSEQPLAPRLHHPIGSIDLTGSPRLLPPLSWGRRADVL